MPVLCRCGRSLARSVGRRAGAGAFQDPGAVASFGLARAGFPFLSEGPLSLGYLGWAVVGIAVVRALTALSFSRRDL